MYDARTEHPLDLVVEQTRARPNGKVLGHFQCPHGHMVLFHDKTGYGIIIVEQDSASSRQATPGTSRKPTGYSRTTWSAC